MRTFLAFCLISAALPLSAGPDTGAELQAALRSGSYPALLYFVDTVGGMYGAKALEFAAALPEDQAGRVSELKDLDRLLRGGKYDRQGENIRREMAKLPGAQWRFVIRLDRERRAIYDRLGPGIIGNLYENTYGSSSRGMQVFLALAAPLPTLVQRTAGPGVKMEPRLCFERTETLRKVMAQAQAGGNYGNWRSEELIANQITVSDSRGLRDELYGGVHNAPCFVYDDGYTHAEIAADAWADSLTPSYTWWYKFDRGSHDYFYGAGARDWCSEAAQNRALKAQIAARRAAAQKNVPAAAPKSSTLNGLRGPGPF